MMERCLGREKLDDLPAGAAQAIQSRRDLVKLNAWMGHAAMAARLLKSNAPEERPLRLVDLGGGDGEFLLRLARRLGREFGAVEALVVDQQEILGAGVKGELAEMGWEVESKRADVLEWSANTCDCSDAVLANLFLHHFDDEFLRKFFEVLAPKTRMLLALEPRRTPLSLALSGMVGIIGCNSVTRHDAWLSVKAGFRAQELSTLWPDRSLWRLREFDPSICTHAFKAVGLRSS